MNKADAPLFLSFRKIWRTYFVEVFLPSALIAHFTKLLMSVHEQKISTVVPLGQTYALAASYQLV